MLRESSSRYLSAERGNDAVLRAIFCADPRPLKVSWRWGSFQLEAGTGSGRFVAEALHKVIPSPYDHMSPNLDVVESTDFFDEEPKLGPGKLTQLTAPAALLKNSSKKHSESHLFRYTVCLHSLLRISFLIKKQFPIILNLSWIFFGFKMPSY